MIFHVFSMIFSDSLFSSGDAAMILPLFFRAQNPSRQLSIEWVHPVRQLIEFTKILTFATRPALLSGAARQVWQSCWEKIWKMMIIM